MDSIGLEIGFEIFYLIFIHIKIDCFAIDVALRV